MTNSDRSTADFSFGAESDATRLVHLRKKFMVWTVAIASSLTTTGAVSLRPSAVWAQEEPAATERKQAEAKQAEVNQAEVNQAEVKQAEVKTEEKKGGFDKDAFSRFLASKEFDQAAEMLDAAIANAPHDSQYDRLNMTLAANQLRSDPETAYQRLSRLSESLITRDNLDMSSMVSLSTAVMYLAQNKASSFDEKLAWVDRSLERIGQSNSTGAQMAVRSILTTKCRLLLSDNRHEQAKTIMDKYLDAARQSIDLEQPSTIQDFITFVSTYSSALNARYPEAVAAVFNEANQFALARLESDQAGVSEYISYYNLNSSRASMLSYSAPREAALLLDGLSEQLKAMLDRMEESEAKKLSRYEGLIASSRSRIESALAREELIGTVAPALDAAHFIGMEAVSMDDLKGKVVLLDFWAVWCGPCIATFPHLTHWHEKYSDKGLKIIGVTKFYGYAWDEEAGRASKPKTPPEADVELAMLESFRESYDLHHGFAVIPKESDYFKAFEVTGIPQAVLLDKEGKIRLIRVGSGEANALALEQEIETLLGSE